MLSIQELVVIFVSCYLRDPRPKFQVHNEFNNFYIFILARDHGIPSYNNYRALCNLKRAATFEDLSREIPTEVIARFKRIYATVDDIDLFPGGMSERPLQGGLVGPTFACIIAIQFRQLRKCDRFW